MSTKNNAEFQNAIREIAYLAPNLDCPYDRVRVTQWMKKLSAMPNEDLEQGKIQNEYAQLLRIQVRNNFIHGLFKTTPPETNKIAPLNECLGNLISKRIPNLPRFGPIAPIVHHRSPDGRAYVAAKQISGGVFCYMAVTPDTLGEAL